MTQLCPVNSTAIDPVLEPEVCYSWWCDLMPQVEVIGGTDKYQAVCRACYGGLMAEKENSAPWRDETPPQALPGKKLDVGFPRKLFAPLHN